MRSLTQILAVALTLLHLSPASARFVIEQGGLKIRLPTTAAKQHLAGFSVSLANFGSPKYGGELVYVATTACLSAARYTCCDLIHVLFRRGRLEYIEKAHGHPETTCTNTDCKYGCSNFTVSLLPSKAAITAWYRTEGHPRPCLQSQANPPFHLNPHANPGNPDEVTNYIMLVDRGPGRPWRCLSPPQAALPVICSLQNSAYDEASRTSSS